MATALNTKCGRGLGFKGTGLCKSAPSGRNEAAKLDIIREEFSSGRTTIYTYEQGKVCFSGYGTFYFYFLINRHILASQKSV